MIEAMSALIPQFTRRRCLQIAAGASIGAPAILRAQPNSAPLVALTIQPSRVISKIPANFTGLSYEGSQLANPQFFAPSNSGLARFVRLLGGQGVLRIGGNSSEYTQWSSGAAAAPASSGAAPPDTVEAGARPRTPVTPEAVRNLAAFVKSCGWQLIYGLNLGNGTPEQAAAERRRWFLEWLGIGSWRSSSATSPTCFTGTGCVRRNGPSTITWPNGRSSRAPYGCAFRGRRWPARMWRATRIGSLPSPKRPRTRLSCSRATITPWGLRRIRR